MALRPVPPRPIVTKRDITRFTQGDCHYLARAINLKTGWPILAFEHEDCGPDLHAFVVMPDGRALDVQGACSVDEMKRRYKADRVRQFAYADFRAAGWLGPEYGKKTYERAHQLAERLVIFHMKAKGS